MKKYLKGASLLLIILLLTTGCGKEIEVKNGSKVAVSTSKEKITATEYYNEIKEDNIRLLIEMIDKSIFDGKYKKYADEEEKEINNQIEQIKTYYGSDEETYTNVLRTYFGVESEKELREKLSLEFKRNKAVEEYVLDEITDKEIEKYYNEKVYPQVKVSHILITSDANEDATAEEKTKAEENALKKAQDIIKKLNDGEKFESLAKKNSQDKATSSNGGDLGYVDLNEMATEFADAVKELKDNEYTKEPVKTQHGYHIILKTGEKNKEKLKDIKDDIKDKIKEEKLNSDSTLYYKTLIKVREKNKLSWNDTTLEKAYNDYMDNLIESATPTTE